MLKKIFSSKFVVDNFYLFIGVSVLNVFGFFFHFYMGRVLGPENYGVLGVLMALVGFMTIPLLTLQISITKFVAILKVKKDQKSINYLHNASLRKLNKIFFLLFLISIPFSIFLSSFLRVSLSLLMLTFALMLIIPSVSVFRGFLQGFQIFKELSWSISIEGLVKFFFGVFFVLLGLRVGGAMVAVFCSLFLAAVYGYYKVKPHIKGEEKKFVTKNIYSYAKPVLFTLLLLVSFYSLDLILVKHFFSSAEAGYYAVINLIGKIVLFASFSVVDVMFPKVVELSEIGKPYRLVLIKSFFVMVLVLFPILLAYFILDDFVVGFLFGSAYLESGIASLIGPYGFFMAFVSLAKLFCVYLLSLARYAFLYFLLTVNVLEALLIYFFHTSLAQVVYVLMGLGAFLFLTTGFLAFISGKAINNANSE